MTAAEPTTGTTALVVAVPEADPPAGDLRRRHDPAAAAGVAAGSAGCPARAGPVRARCTAVDLFENPGPPAPAVWQPVRRFALPAPA